MVASGGPCCACTDTATVRMTSSAIRARGRRKSERAGPPVDLFAGGHMWSGRTSFAWIETARVTCD
jgi:hypothetical protein